MKFQWQYFLNLASFLPLWEGRVLVRKVERIMFNVRGGHKRALNINALFANQIRNDIDSVCDNEPFILNKRLESSSFATSSHLDSPISV